jgi:hypothetical protein
MNRRAGQAIFFAIAALVLTAANWAFGLHLLPSMAEAQEGGIFVPWSITWGMIWMTTIAGILLAGFLLTRRSE